MNRFFAFGCSYTCYSWPTWADLLGIDFDLFENWGIPGLGNQAIFERLIEAHAKNKFGPDDLVIIQWSSYLRFDWYNRFVLKERTSNWKTDGSIFAERNEHIFDKKWQYLFFDEMAYVMHTLNFISAAQNLLENVGCRWYMTSIGDIRKLNFDIKSQPEYAETISDNSEIEKRFPELEFYLNSIWNERSDRWLQPIQPFCYTQEAEFYTFKKSTKTLVDNHPPPRYHQKWLVHELSDKLWFNMNVSDQEFVVNSVDKIYEEKKHLNRKNFDQVMYDGNFEKPINMVYPNKYKGIY